MTVLFAIQKEDSEKETCPACNHSWWFNTRNIPSGEKYECTCPKCGILLMRKKV